MPSSFLAGTALAAGALPFVGFGDLCRRRQLARLHVQGNRKRSNGSSGRCGAARLEASDRDRVHARSARQLRLGEETR